MWKPTEDELRRAFKRLVFNPAEWRRKACQLRRSAEKLELPVLVFWERFKIFGRWHSDQFPPGDYLDAYYLLWGYAIENLLKSCIVNSIGKRLEQEFDAEQAGAPNKRSKLPKELASHKQLKLASHVGLRLNVHIISAKEHTISCGMSTELLGRALTAQLTVCDCDARHLVLRERCNCGKVLRTDLPSETAG